MQNVFNKNLFKGLTKNKKPLNDLDTLTLFGKAMIKEKEEHAKASRLPFAKEGYDNAVIDFAIEIAKARESKEFSDEELKAYIKNSIQI